MSPARTALRARANTADDQSQDDEGDHDERQGGSSSLGLARRANTVESDTAALSNAPDDPFGAQTQSIAVAPGTKLGDHVLTAGLAGESIRHPLFEAVPNLDPDPALTKRQQNQEAVLLFLVTDSAPMVLEQSIGIFANVTVTRDCRHGRDHYDVAARGKERAAHAIDGRGARWIDHPGEVVDGLCQFRQLLPVFGGGGSHGQQQHGDRRPRGATSAAQRL